MPVIVEPSSPLAAANAVPGSVVTHLRDAGAPPTRVASFHEYYNQVIIDTNGSNYLELHVRLLPCPYPSVIMDVTCRGLGKLVRDILLTTGATHTLGYITKVPRAPTNVHLRSHAYPYFVIVTLKYCLVAQSPQVYPGLIPMDWCFRWRV